MNNEKNFLDFQYAKPAEEAVAQDTAVTKLTVAVNITTNLAENPDALSIDKIQATCCAIEMVSKDLHYRAKGKPFYGVHLLADLVHKIGDSKDSLNEVFYLGDKAMPPPLMCYTTVSACKVIEELGLSTDKEETELIDGLRSLCDRVTYEIEDAKKNYEYKAGVQAVLDSISADALQATGLLHRTSTEVDIQASGAAMEEGKTEEAAVPPVVISETVTATAPVESTKLEVVPTPPEA